MQALAAVESARAAALSKISEERATQRDLAKAAAVEAQERAAVLRAEWEAAAADAVSKKSAAEAAEANFAAESKAAAIQQKKAASAQMLAERAQLKQAASQAETTPEDVSEKARAQASGAVADPRAMLAAAQSTMAGLSQKNGEEQIEAAMKALELMTSAVRQQSGEDGVMQMLKSAKQECGGGQMTATTEQA